MKKLLFVSLLFFTSLQAGVKDLVDISKVDDTIVLDLRYATPNNFTKQTVYAQAKCYVLNFIAEKLKAVQKELKEMGLGLKIWDGFRTFDGQCKLWEIMPDPRYVAPPSKGGRHTRGTTVDVTLVDLKTGKELEMPTEFDNFTEKAHANHDGCSDEAKKNRAMLKRVMEKQGFVQLPTEWWHFDLKDYLSYEPIKATFEEIEKVLGS